MNKKIRDAVKRVEHRLEASINTTMSTSYYQFLVDIMTILDRVKRKKK